MTDSDQREQQLIIAAAFFRRLLAEDVSGVDVGLAEQLMEALVASGERPATLQYSCAFEESTRAAGRWLYVYGPDQLRGPHPKVVPVDLARRLLRICELPFDMPGAGAAFEAGLDGEGVRAVSVGFDARVVPSETRVRLAAQLAPGPPGLGFAGGVLRELGLSSSALGKGGACAEIALDYGPRGLADLRVSYPVAPTTLAETEAIAGEPFVTGLLRDARGALLVRSLRSSTAARLVIVYGGGEAGEVALASVARRSPLAGDFQRQMRRANRDLPGETNIVLQPWGVTVALQRSQPNPQRFSLLLRPIPFWPA